MKNILLVLVSAMFLFACKPAKKETLIESGYVKYKMNEGNMSVNNSVYFRNGGKEEASIMEVDAVTAHKNYILRKGGYIYTYMSDSKEGQKSKYVKADANYMPTYKLTNAMKNAGKKVGTEKLLGKECTVYEISGDDNMKVSTWKGLVLKVEKNGEVKLEAVEVDIEKEVPANVFEIPKDINFDGTATKETEPKKQGDSDFDEEGAKG